MVRGTAIVYTEDLLHTLIAKTCHGLLRGTERFEILGVIDSANAGRDAGEVMDGRRRGIHVYSSIETFLTEFPEKPDYFIIGVAFHGGILPPSGRKPVITALKNGISVVSGLHKLLGDDEELVTIARRNNAEIVDVRRPRPTNDLQFWTGDIYSVRAPRIAVLGTDCAVGKRTTCRFLMEACRDAGITTEMIYTGQTGWMQGSKHGFIFDSTINDFISGELERVIVECDREERPQLMLVEGQSSLRNPSGPCGSEIIISADCKGVILQHQPSREMFDGTEAFGCKIPTIAEEIELIRIYGAETLAVTLSEQDMSEADLSAYRDKLETEIGIPVVRPLAEGVQRLVEVVQRHLGA